MLIKRQLTGIFGRAALNFYRNINVALITSVFLRLSPSISSFLLRVSVQIEFIALVSQQGQRQRKGLGARGVCAIFAGCAAFSLALGCASPDWPTQSAEL